MTDVAIVEMIGVNETTTENRKIVEMDGAVIPIAEVIEIIAKEIVITVSETLPVRGSHIYVTLKIFIYRR